MGGCTPFARPKMMGRIARVSGTSGGPTRSCDGRNSSSLFSFPSPPPTYLRTVGVGTDSRSILLQPHGGTLDLKQMIKAITVFRPGFA